MRTGTVILMFMLVLIFFGVLLYYSIEKTRELNDIQDQLAQVQAALETLEVQYQDLEAENQRLSAENSNLAGANASLLAQLSAVEQERQAFKDQVTALQAHLAVIERAHPVLTWLTSSSAYRYAFLLFVPFVPITFGVVYITRRNRINPSHRQGTSPSVIHTALTEEEYRFIVQRRKLQALSSLPRRAIDSTIVG